MPASPHPLARRRRGRSGIFDWQNGPRVEDPDRARRYVALCAEGILALSPFLSIRIGTDAALVLADQLARDVRRGEPLVPAVRRAAQAVEEEWPEHAVELVCCLIVWWGEDQPLMPSHLTLNAAREAFTDSVMRRWPSRDPGLQAYLDEDFPGVLLPRP